MSQLPLYEIEALDRGKYFKHYEFSNNIVDPETHIPDEQSEAIRQAPYPAGYESKPTQRVKLSPSISNRDNPYFTCVRPPDYFSHLPTHAYRHSDMQPPETAVLTHSYPQVESCAPTPQIHVPLGNSTPRANGGENQDVSNLIRFMARREIVSTGLLQFDDCPENYRAWKASFFTTTKDLNLTAKEEMDLLVKWLGADSREQAKRIRAVHVENPGRGRLKIWERIDDCFGAPEVVESSLLRRIETFPKISNRDW